jgi:hypothetical protein
MGVGISMPSQAVGKFPTRAQFYDELNSVFRAVVGDDAVAEFELVRLDEFVDSEVQENFALTFKTRPDIPANQSIYNLEHDKLGAVSVFLVPVKRDNEGLYFEAVFNYLKN